MIDEQKKIVNQYCFGKILKYVSNDDIFVFFSGLQVKEVKKSSERP